MQLLQIRYKFKHTTITQKKNEEGATKTLYVLLITSICKLIYFKLIISASCLDE
jgi:hypothetical protein